MWKHAPLELLYVLLSSTQAVLLAMLSHSSCWCVRVCARMVLLQGCLVHDATADNNSSNNSPRLGCWAAAAAGAGAAAGVCPWVVP